MKSKAKRPLRRRVTERMREMLGLVKVDHGAHDGREEGMCVMEAVAYIAGEPHSDHPACVSDTITEVMIEANDNLDDIARQRLLEVVPEIIGSGWNGAGKTKAERKAEIRQVAAMKRKAADILENDLQIDLDFDEVSVEPHMLVYTLRDVANLDDKEIVEHVLEVVRAAAKERASLQEIRADLDTNNVVHAY